MQIGTYLAIYFVVWWLCLFVVLPFKVRNQIDEGHYIQGTEPGAPAGIVRLWPKLLITTLLAAVVTGLTLYNGSVVAELVRSGVHSLPRGQSEAGLSIGLTPGQVLRSIQLPQALTAMLPALIGQMVVVLKDSALGYAITYLELLNWSKTLGSAYANTVPAYLVAALLFILMNYALTKFAGFVQARLTQRRHSAAPVTTNAPNIVQGGAEPGATAAAGEQLVAAAARARRERHRRPGAVGDEGEGDWER